MKELKIDGVITITDEMDLQRFCEQFNIFMDKLQFGFSGRIEELYDEEDK